MLAWLNRFSRTPDPVPDADWSAACADIALCSKLPPDLIGRLRADAARFLHEKTFSGAHHLALEDSDRLRIAILACLPVVALGFDWLRGWSEVIVYPGQFRVRRHLHDDESGVVSEMDDWLSGESWSHGPLILSLEDIREDLDDPFAGFNLVAHEIAHKLDMRDGVANGVPPQPDRASFDRWVAVFQREYEAFQQAVDRGDDTPMDPYAAESPDEFFAVASETYFSLPELLAEHHPAVHRELRRFYGVELD
jgi:Mlc titration factor MtfA (ptsG expression regulator)